MFSSSIKKHIERTTDYDNDRYEVKNYASVCMCSVRFVCKVFVCCSVKISLATAHSLFTFFLKTSAKYFPICVYLCGLRSKSHCQSRGGIMQTCTLHASYCVKRASLLQIECERTLNGRRELPLAYRIIVSQSSHSVWLVVVVVVEEIGQRMKRWWWRRRLPRINDGTVTTHCIRATRFQ